MCREALQPSRVRQSIHTSASGRGDADRARRRTLRRAQRRHTRVLARPPPTPRPERGSVNHVLTLVVIRQKAQVKAPLARRWLGRRQAAMSRPTVCAQQLSDGGDGEAAAETELTVAAAGADSWRGAAADAARHVTVVVCVARAGPAGAAAGSGGSTGSTVLTEKGRFI